MIPPSTVSIPGGSASVNDGYIVRPLAADEGLRFVNSWFEPSPRPLGEPSHNSLPRNSHPPKPPDPPSFIRPFSAQPVIEGGRGRSTEQPPSVAEICAASSTAWPVRAPAQLRPIAAPLWQGYPVLRPLTTGNPRGLPPATPEPRRTLNLSPRPPPYPQKMTFVHAVSTAQPQVFSPARTAESPPWPGRFPTPKPRGRSSSLLGDHPGQYLHFLDDPLSIKSIPEPGFLPPLPGPAPVSPPPLKEEKEKVKKEVKGVRKKDKKTFRARGEEGGREIDIHLSTSTHRPRALAAVLWLKD